MSRLARHIKCHPGYLSKALNEKSVSLSIEQADLVNEYFGHNEEESDYFFTLVLWDRAGSQRLKSRFHRKILNLQENHLRLKNLFKREGALESGADFYYRNWYHNAIHLILRIPFFQTQSLEKCALALAIPSSVVKETLEGLRGCKLVEVSSNGLDWRSAPSRIHLGDDSPHIQRHHTNWRLQAIASLPRARVQELHYSSIITLAEKDIAQVRATLVDCIEKVRKTVKKSDPDEVLYCYSLDLFKATL